VLDSGRGVDRQAEKRTVTAKAVVKRIRRDCSIGIRLTGQEVARSKLSADRRLGVDFACKSGCFDGICLRLARFLASLATKEAYPYLARSAHQPSMQQRLTAALRRPIPGGTEHALMASVPGGHMPLPATESEPGFESRIGRSVSLEHAARLLGVSRRTIYNRIRDGRLQTIRTLGGSQRVLLDSVQEDRGQVAEMAFRNSQTY
jgi:excisionase family DNA binding protein